MFSSCKTLDSTDTSTYINTYTGRVRVCENDTVNVDFAYLEGRLLSFNVFPQEIADELRHQEGRFVEFTRNNYGEFIGWNELEEEFENEFMLRELPHFRFPIMGRPHEERLLFPLPPITE